MTREPANGGSAAAFFDLDGTLIPEPSLERRFYQSLKNGQAIPMRNYFFWFFEATRLLPAGILRVRYANKSYLTGLNTDLALEHWTALPFFGEGLERMLWHAQKGHEIVLVSGTLQPLAEQAARALECELEARGEAVRLHILATRLEESRGRWTGRLAGEALYGAAKAKAVAELARTQQWNLSESHAYGNSPLDQDVLTVVGHGHAVNPGRELAAIANRQDWPVWHWHQERKAVSRVNSKSVSEVTTLEGQA